MTTEIARHKTALVRIALSRPTQQALEDGVLREGLSFFDYGCGHGGDLDRLGEMGFACAGYDPVHHPEGTLLKSDVVNLGYVVNVIEDEAERAETLRRAWSLAGRTFIVSARLAADSKRLRGDACGDGVLTGAGTFQKVYTQDALRAWIETTLETRAIAAVPGVFYIFRDVAEEQRFLLWRVRRPRRRPAISEGLFKQHEDLLQSLMSFIEDYGRLPRAGELPQEEALRVALGSVRQAFLVVKRVTGEERWDRIRMSHYEDLLVYLALARFTRRPKLSHLPPVTQYSVKDFFGSYKAACAQADRLLFLLADTQRVTEACRAATVGKPTPSALYLHTSALSEVAPILRVMDGSAKALVGTVPNGTLVKFHLDRPRVSYLGYPDFETDAHPALEDAYVVDLDRLRVDYRDYRDVANPPILHRKELFVPTWYPGRDKYARLTAAEVRAGLYGDPSRIGTRSGWEEVLDAAGLHVAGHRLRRVGGRATGHGRAR